MFTYLSYRDPNLLKTVDVYDGTPGFLRGLELDQVSSVVLRCCSFFLMPSLHNKDPLLD
jgi:Zn-dependent M16 (insulinase) family peptidase